METTKTFRVGIVGGTGYTGVELLRLLLRHPSVHLEVITSRAEVGTAVASMFPSLRGMIEQSFLDPNEATTRDRLSHCDVVFFATPHGVAMQMAPQLIESGVRVIDLGADFRLRDPILFKHWYGQEHTAPQYLGEAVYGLPELNRAKLKGARLIAMPGCYPTAMQLGLGPLVRSGWIEEDTMIADCKSGISGAGRKAELGLLYAENAENFHSYGMAGHRHHPETVQGLSDWMPAVADKVADKSAKVGLIFVPHLVPMVRGLQATLYARVRRGLDISLVEGQQLFERVYAGEPFVDVLPAGGVPETRSVRGANLCRIALHGTASGRVIGGDGTGKVDTIIVLSVIDNLVKGAAGQAIQAMNIACGLDESMGLRGIALVP